HPPLRWEGVPRERSAPDRPDAEPPCLPHYPCRAPRSACRGTEWGGELRHPGTAWSPALIWNIPNLLTVLRVLAAPFVALVFAFFETPLAGWIAFVLFTAAALTDFVDGWAARRWGQVSEMGKM